VILSVLSASVVKKTPLYKNNPTRNKKPFGKLRI
jgi:hypothetical protein